MDEQDVALISSRSPFETWRRRLGFGLAPVVFLLLWWLPLPGLDTAAHRLLAVFGMVVVLWVSEAIPLPVTALLGPALCVLCGVSSEREVFKSFGNPIIFLFLGSFLLAEAMLRHGLNRRIAFHILSWPWVAKTPTRILAAFGTITALLSMWISNTTATAMMFPIGLAILRELAGQTARTTGRAVQPADLPFSTGLMLTAAFASSIGGLATPVGTPPNLIAIGFLEKGAGVKITFFEWMGFALPLSGIMLAFLVVYMNRVCPAPTAGMGASAAWIQTQKAQLGRLGRAERNVLCAFGVTVALWILPGAVALGAGVEAPLYRWLNQHLPEGVCALIGATLLFVLPIHLRRGDFTGDWAMAKRIDWGTILLFGGGLALGEAMFATGLAKWIGEGLARTFDAHTAVGLTVLFTLVAVLLTETTSNTATASMVVPVAMAVAGAARVDPIQPAIAACLGASLAFMLPVSTPPNAIVYGSGCVPLPKMLRHGAVLDLVGVGAIVIVVQTWMPLALK